MYLVSCVNHNVIVLMENYYGKKLNETIFFDRIQNFVFEQLGQLRGDAQCILIKFIIGVCPVMKSAHFVVFSHGNLAAEQLAKQKIKLFCQKYYTSLL